MERTHRILLAAIVLAVAACTAGDPAPENQNDKAINVQILARINVCLPWDGDLGDATPCTDIALPNADVAIRSSGETVWTGKTDDFGRVQASFTPHDEWIAVVSSQWINHDMTSEAWPVDADVTGFDLITNEQYELRPRPPQPES